MRFQWLPAVLFGVAASAGCGSTDSSDTGSNAPIAGSDIEPEDVLDADCQSDEDCELAPQYCTSCRCVALAEGEEVPECNGTIVECLVNPCLKKRAVCSQGSCTVE